jgi:hypothetical protein
MTETDRLMGRVADTWFRGNGEPMATRALERLLQNPHLFAATLAQLGDASKRDLSDVRYFVAERIQENGGRADLVGLDAQRLPRVVVEAKFNAYLTADQVRKYLDDQERSFADRSVDHALVLLMPESRVTEAENLLDVVRTQRSAEGVQPYAAGLGVLSWDAWIDHWETAIADLPQTPDSLAADLVQLRSACRALGGIVIEPFTADPSAEWRERESELGDVVKEATLRLLPEGTRPADLPMTRGDAVFGPFRYLPTGLPDGWMALGLAGRFADAGLSPIWIRLAKNHPDWPTVKERVLTSAVGATTRQEYDHLWIPLVINPDLPGPALVGDLVRQTESIRRLLEA